jgi:hypothetical protein
MDTPFKKLEPFGECDAPFFFGRESESRLIAADLFASPLSILYGESGVGKSSLLRAGVMPLLRSKPDLLAVIVSEWQTDPIGSIKLEVVDEARKWMAEGGTERDAALAEIERLVSVYAEEAGVEPSTGPAPLEAFLLSCAKRVGRRVLLILDQFEEFFEYHSTDDALVQQLPDVVVPGTLSIRVLISLREDAVTKLDVFEDTIPQLFSNYRRVDHLDRASAEAAIRGPVDRYNALNQEAPAVTPEDEFVHMVLDDVPSGGAVPGADAAGVAKARPSSRLIDTSHLQLVVSRIWDEEVKKGSRVLRADTFKALGGAEQIIKTHFDSVMAAHSIEDQELACKALRFLVTRSGTKVAHSAADLAEFASVSTESLSSVLRKLSQGERRVLRKVRPHLDSGEALFEVYHDRVALAILDWITRFRRERDAFAVVMTGALRTQRWAVSTAAILFTVASAMWIGIFEPTLARYAANYNDLARLRRRADRQGSHLADLRAKRSALQKEQREAQQPKGTQDPQGQTTYDRLSDALGRIHLEEQEVSAAFLASSNAHQALGRQIVQVPGMRDADPLRVVSYTAAAVAGLLAGLATLVVLSRRSIGRQLRSGPLTAAPSLRAAVEITDILGTPYRRHGGLPLALLAGAALIVIQLRLFFLTLQQSPMSSQRVAVFVESSALIVLIACVVAYFREVAVERSSAASRA